MGAHQRSNQRQDNRDPQSEQSSLQASAPAPGTADPPTAGRQQPAQSTFFGRPVLVGGGHRRLRRPTCTLALCLGGVIARSWSTHRRTHPVLRAVATIPLRAAARLSKYSEASFSQDL